MRGISVAGELPMSEIHHAGGGSLLALAIIVLASIPPAAASRDLEANTRAFPGATGFGAAAIGWRGGVVVPVTSLADHGTGTLRACAEDRTDPRVCIFEIGGTINLEKSIFVGSNVYIAGQTAPGEGIQLRNHSGKTGPLIVKNATDVVIRFLKVRPGRSDTPSPAIDAITVENGRRVYLGNLSMGFATDETFNVHVSNSIASDITLADSILALSLDRAGHPKGRHSKGALICSEEGKVKQCGRITILRNLFAHHRDRNPDIKGTDLGPVEVINNVFYDPISQFGEFYDLLGNARIAYVGNVALTGPSTISDPPEAVQVFDWNQNADVYLYTRDNMAGSAKGCRKHDVKVLDPVAAGSQVSPGWPLSAPVMPTDKVLKRVLARAGDRLPDGRHRDVLDARVVKDVLNCTGRVINQVNEVGGWPELPIVQAPTDSDGDGLPDIWEASTPGLDPIEPSDPWGIPPGGTISYLEFWLAHLAADRS
jgi:pectate lyase